jgi:hypothetical protein
VDSSIRFNVSANTAQFQSGMRQVDSAAKSTAAGIKQAFSGLGGLLVGGAALAGLKSLMDDFDRVAKLATRFGASAEDIQRVSVAADLAGVSIDTVARVLTKMSVAASEAGNGSKEMAEAFDRAGINAEKFKNAGFSEQLVMLSEAFNRARGDADATNQIIELMGTRAAGQMIPLIDNTAALRAEMEGVSVASDDVVRKIEAANDRLTRLQNDSKVFFADVLEFLTDSSERIGSILAQGNGLLRLINGLANAQRGNFQPLAEVLATARTIEEMEQIELRAQAIAQLTREGLLSGDAAEQAKLIAERMEQIQNKLKGNKVVVSKINDELVETNALEKEKTSELERQQRLLEQQEAKRKDAIKDAQFEVELIEAKLRGDKARVAALEEQRDFEDALEKTGSTEVAANLAAAKAAERAAQSATTTAASPSSASTVAAPEAQSALDSLRQASETNPEARAALGRIEADLQRTGARSGVMRGFGGFTSAANAEIRAERRAERAAQRALERMVQDAAKTEKQRTEEVAAANATGAATRQADPMSAMAGDIKAIKNVLTKADGIHDRLPIRVLAA